ncbi:MAG: nitric oxide reductase activation protein NorD [Ignavibacteria bacterium]
MADLPAVRPPHAEAHWGALDCGFAQVAEVFDECLADALEHLSAAELDGFIAAGRFLGKMGRGPEPLLAFLEVWPGVAARLGGEVLGPVMDLVRALQASPNSAAIAPLLQTLGPAARRLHTPERLRAYLDLAHDLAARTTGSIHGRHATLPSPGLPGFLRKAPELLGMLSMEGLRNWVDYGVRNHAKHPERQAEYFSLESPDSRAVLQRERHGTLFADVERKLDLTLRALWRDSDTLIPYSNAQHELRKIVPYYDRHGLRLPDVFDARDGVGGLDRYRAVLAHMAGHRRHSQPQVADNWSPFQRMAVEFFEDARIDALAMREYPGLGRILLALHPKPVEGACDADTQSCLRHRLAMLSRAFLDPAHGYRDALVLEFAGRFRALLEGGPSSTAEVASLALAYVARSRRPSDQFASVFFDDTVVDYRDDNRQLWKFIEEGDEEQAFDRPQRPAQADELQGLPPRHYREWDYASHSFKPDWVSLYEALHPAADPGAIDAVLQKHAALAKRLQRLLDMLKPQERMRIRYQEEGADLDLDIALRSLVDMKCGAAPDPRINFSHRSSGRSIAVTLLLDLSESLNRTLPATGDSILELSREAAALLAWVTDRLGDACAIAGFRSNTRHDVRYYHLKGFSEGWGDEVKARLAAMSAGWSTRMGAAIRHAAHTLEHRRADKKILLVLTDGEPADVDVEDEAYLRADARKAVEELAARGITSFCLSLDPGADEYVRDIFGKYWRVLERIERLPEVLPQLYLQMTR